MGWTCATCGVEHSGLPLNWSFDEPTYWQGPRGPNDRLDEDLCVWTDDDGHETYFIRGILELPILDTDAVFAYGVWSSLSENSYRRIVELWKQPESAEEPPYFGWLSNQIPDFPDTLNLPLDVWMLDAQMRPTLTLHSGEHPLIDAQHDGVTMDWVRSVAESRLHPV